MGESQIMTIFQNSKGLKNEILPSVKIVAYFKTQHG